MPSDIPKDVKENASEIAELLFPDVTESVESLYEKYPARNLPLGSKVTRFGPSPTGFLHLDGLFTALVSQRLAHQEERTGVFYLRLEDTDKKREVEHGVHGITDALSKFNIPIDEGILNDEQEIGAYGPYKQSERKEIYSVFIKYLISNGHAYPCFCTPEELEAARKSQEMQKIKPGYYGEWAKHRTSTKEEIEEEKRKEIERKEIEEEKIERAEDADHARFEQLFFEGVLHPRNGNLRPQDARPGLGLELRRADAEKFAA